MDILGLAMTKTAFRYRIRFPREDDLAGAIIPHAPIPRQVHSVGKCGGPGAAVDASAQYLFSVSQDQILSLSRRNDRIRCQAVVEIAVAHWKAKPGRASLDIGGQLALGGHGGVDGSVSFGKGPAPSPSDEDASARSASWGRESGGSATAPHNRVMASQPRQQWRCCPTGADLLSPGGEGEDGKVGNLPRLLCLDELPPIFSAACLAATNTFFCQPTMRSCKRPWI